MKTLTDNPKEPYRVYIKVDDKFVEQDLWTCGECGQIHHSGYEFAQNCCKQHYCQCGKKVNYSYEKFCRTCREKINLEKAK